MDSGNESRRRFLRRSGALVVAGTAGCLADSSGETDTPPDADSTTPPTGTAGPPSGTSRNCPSDAGAATATPIPEEELVMERNDLGVGGTRVALEGNVVLGGFPRMDTTDGVRAGEVRVTHLGTDDHGTITPNADGNRIDHEFGAAVALHRKRALIAAPGYENADGVRIGAAYVFERSGDDWTQQARLTIQDTPPYPTTRNTAGATTRNRDWETDVSTRSRAQHRMRRVVALHGQTALLSTQTVEDGAVYPFEKTEGDWVRTGAIVPNERPRGDALFGYAMAVSGDTAIVGSRRRVHVFERTCDDWTQQATFTGKDEVEGAGFGHSVTLDGDTAVVGAPEDWGEIPGERRGAAYVFERSEEGWNRQARLVADRRREVRNFGKAVALEGDWIVVDSGDQDGSGYGERTLFLFRRSDEGWNSEGVIDMGDATDDDVRSIPFDRGRLVVGDRLIPAEPGQSDGDGTALPPETRTRTERRADDPSDTKTPIGTPDPGSEVDEYLMEAGPPANGYEGTITDRTGEDQVTVEVGAGDSGRAFDPAAVRIDSGTLVRFEWTGRGGVHNIIAVDGPADLESGEAIEGSGVEYEYTFDSPGNTFYLCEPHGDVGMRGAIRVV
jgi:halocyanin-like protein